MKWDNDLRLKGAIVENSLHLFYNRAVGLFGNKGGYFFRITQDANDYIVDQIDANGDGELEAYIKWKFNAKTLEFEEGNVFYDYMERNL